MWGIPAFLFLIAFVHRAAPGVIAKDLMQAFNATGAIVGLLSATYFYAYAALMIPAGLLIDAFGPRRVIAAGSAVMGLGSLAMGVAVTQPVLFTGRFLVGLGATVTFIGALKIAANWFPPSHFATLSAITAAVGILGALLSTLPLAALVSWVTWRGAFVLIGVTTVTGALACFIWVRDHPPGRPETSQATPTLRAVFAGLIEVMSNVHTWPPFLAFFFLYGATGNLMLWSIPYLRDIYGLTTTAAAACAAFVSFALLFSAPLTGYLSDRVLKRRKLPYTLLVSALFACWAVMVATLGALPLWGVYALFFAMGTVGAAFVLTWPLGREVNPPALAGIAVAVANLGGFLGAALTQGPIGAVLDSRWTGVMAGGARVYPLDAYRAAFAVCAAFVLTAAGLSLLLKETRGENIYARLRTGGTRGARA
ncbi:MAG TPA: MFS transporter [Methylomirabilota bacterium]|nr:MFS transporter [Methylomirabilota bacterium]